MIGDGKRDGFGSRIDAAILVALAALASLVVHQLAYVLAYPMVSLGSITGIGNTAGFGNTGSFGDHGHVSAQWAIVTPVAVLSAVALILRQVRNLTSARGGVSALVRPASIAMIAGPMFVGQETIEGLLAGQSIGQVLTHPAVVLGILLVPLVSMVIVRLLRRVGEIVAQKATLRAEFRFASDSVVAAPRRVRVFSSVVSRVSAPRGPPAWLVRI